jgi:MoxR-like ATPase
MSVVTLPEISTQLGPEGREFQATFAAVRREVGQVIVGQERVVEAVLTALFCGGNVLLEGVPGLGKTELIKALSRVLELEFRRIQFTPDLMPSDIIGTSIMSPDETGKYRFEFRQGPIFTQLLLADEINRASPKTQSALLETMQEGSVTTGGTMYTLTQPFFVMATQNPLEQEGTYPLPEAQLDRFLFKTVVPFPSRSELNDVVSRTILKRPIHPAKVLNAAGILANRAILDGVVVAPPMQDYAVRLVLSTHPGTDFATEDVRKFVKWGASPRAAQALIRAARVRALTQGSNQVAFEDIAYWAQEVLQHRILLNYDGLAENVSVAAMIQDCLKKLPKEA